MEKEILTKNIDQVARQRNLFLSLLVICLFTILLLSTKLMLTKEKVILVPGLNQEVWTTEHGVSSSYLEETAAMYLPLLLDLNADSIDWKRERLMSHVSQSDEKYMKMMTEYFGKTKEKYQQFTLSTHFAVKSFEVDSKKMFVIAHGQLSSRFGERGFESIPASYGLGFEWVAGKLMLTQFVKSSKEKEETYEKPQN